ncbi:hypothetical protein [Candidatus Aeolococcus gillhamiae]|uniref:hypothetical protein n=1 Tax=Candidatus Aeolococcus gillhamiae TaxID=3127015 RepID=UPI0030780769
MSLAYWSCALVTVASALVSLGFSIAAVVASNDEAKTNALYAWARSSALALVSVVALVHRSSPWLEAVALTMTLVQVADAGVGYRTRNAMKTYGPAITGLANLATFVWLVGTS